MARLRSDILKKSRLIEPLKSTSHLSLKKSKIQKISRFALDNRGGADIEYVLASKSKDLIMNFAAGLKEKELRAKIFKFLFTYGRLILQLFLYSCKIDLQYVVLGPVNPQVIVIACCTGGTTGFVLSWFSVGAILVAPPTLFSIFLLRSLTQQIQNTAEYNKFKSNIRKFLSDENFQDEVKNRIIEIQKRIRNSNLEDLNWNKNPELKEAAERLGIFENAPSATGPLNLDTLDPDPELNKILEEFGIIKKSNPKIHKTRRRGKTVYFRDFVAGMVDSDNESDLGIIDAEIIQEPERIRIRDKD
jgi:hypothetical protein